jgi:PEP-CTERM motif
MQPLARCGVVSFRAKSVFRRISLLVLVAAVASPAAAQVVRRSGSLELAPEMDLIWEIVDVGDGLIAYDYGVSDNTVGSWEIYFSFIGVTQKQVLGSIDMDFEAEWDTYKVLDPDFPYLQDTWVPNLPDYDPEDANPAVWEELRSSWYGTSPQYAVSSVSWTIGTAHLIDVLNVRVATPSGSDYGAVRFAHVVAPANAFGGVHGWVTRNGVRYEIPEPTTMALLVLGSLAAFRRRR